MSCTEPQSQGFWFVGLGWGQEICIFNRFLGGAALLGPHFQNHCSDPPLFPCRHFSVGEARRWKTGVSKALGAGDHVWTSRCGACTVCLLAGLVILATEGGPFLV